MAKKLEKTTEGLRDMLLSELEDYINGLNTTERMNTITKATTAVCKTVVIDLEARKMLNRENFGKDKSKVVDDLDLNLKLTNKK